jgi:hypothetical protein
VVRVPVWSGNFPLHHCVHPAYPLGGTRGLFPWGQSGQGVKLTTHFHLVPRSIMRGAIPSLPQYAFMAWCSVKAQGQLYIYLNRSTFCISLWMLLIPPLLLNRSTPKIALRMLSRTAGNLKYQHADDLLLSPLTTILFFFTLQKLRKLHIFGGLLRHTGVAPTSEVRTATMFILLWMGN